MKMSDVFGNRNITSSGTIITDRDIERSNLGAFNTNSMAKAAAHAINQHDALVAMNKELVEALESELENDYIHPQGKKSIRETLAKAKELSQ